MAGSPYQSRPCPSSSPHAPWLHVAQVLAGMGSLFWGLWGDVKSLLQLSCCFFKLMQSFS